MLPGKEQNESAKWWRFVVFALGAGIIFIPSFLVIDWYYQTGLFESYTAEFFAGFVGVTLALGLERYRSSNERRNRIAELQGLLKQELERMLELLSQDEFRLLDWKVWESLVRSGEVIHMRTEIQTKLFGLYAEIDSYNRLLERTQQSQIMASSVLKFRVHDIGFLYRELREKTELRRKELLDEIRGVLSQDKW
jgi:hypothetical protein